MSSLELFCANDHCKKHQIFEKWDDVENRPSCRGYSPFKGYIFWKMFSLGQKLKWPKTSGKRFYKKTRVLLCKIRWKKHQTFEKLDDFKNRPSSKGCSLCKMVSLGQKLKCVRTCEKRMYKHTRVVLCKKPLEKTPNIREVRRFWKSAMLHRL